MKDLQKRLLGRTSLPLIRTSIILSPLTTQSVLQPGLISSHSMVWKLTWQLTGCSQATCRNTIQPIYLETSQLIQPEAELKAETSVCLICPWVRLLRVSTTRWSPPKPSHCWRISTERTFHNAWEQNMKARLVLHFGIRQDIKWDMAQLPRRCWYPLSLQLTVAANQERFHLMPLNPYWRSCPTGR